MGTRQRDKCCDRCHLGATVLYRVQWDGSGQWQFVCPTCWPEISQHNPNYVYGGTWKAKKR